MSGKSSSMRGLTVFIADIRNCRSREQEEKRINKELANIRAKFKGWALSFRDSRLSKTITKYSNLWSVIIHLTLSVWIEGGLSGYDRKKYVCKLLYMYILGWDVNFGHLEAVNLISSSKYSEKQIGYLAVTLLLTENSDMARLVVNSMKKDLEDLNEINNCLALHAIANIGGREMAEALGADVNKLLISGNTKSFVKKKAALCLLRLYRKYPDVLPVTDWAERIVSIMEDHNLGVALSTTSLIIALSQQYPDAYARCVIKAIDRLHRIVIEKDYSPEYIYYKVPIPWLQIKLLRLLQQYPPTAEPGLLGRLYGVLSNIINAPQEASKNPQHNNAQNAVLFEAINLAVHLNPDSELVQQACGIVGKFLESKETNSRYLALESMANIANYISSLEPLKKHQTTVFLALKDKDVSVRKQALDLLYSMCDSSNAKAVVAELLGHLAGADYAMREEMVLKIAILTEKFATDFEWYVDSILTLISSAGDSVGDEVWYRVVQIITNNPSLRSYAAEKLLNSINQPACHEMTLKVAAYILGECGHELNRNPIDLFRPLHAKFNIVSQPTKAQLLTTYAKFVNLFPEIKGEIMQIFNAHKHVLDVELQQRACEYLTIAMNPNEDVMAELFDAIPPAPLRESALLARLAKKQGDANGKVQSAVRPTRPTPTATSSTPVNAGAGSANADNLLDLGGNMPPAARSGPTGGNGKDIDLLGLDFGSDSTSSVLPSLSPGQTAVSPITEKLFMRFYYAVDGVIYEDATLQVGIKSQFQTHYGGIALYLGNKTNSQLSDFTIYVHPSSEVNSTVGSTFGSAIAPMNQVQHVINLECLKIITTPPLVTISFTIQASNQKFSTTIKLPLLISKFLEPVPPMSAADFFNRWQLLGPGPKEAMSIGKFNNGVVNHAFIKSALTGMKWSILEGIDPIQTNYVCAAVLHTSGAGKIGCLMRIETSVENGVCFNLLSIFAG
ncbi:adaptin N terminal region-domain-containing protein [Paraphysoderma sedebokerense]|nr:adaptin N terminal region-domain-containing protein [Paraphysoderma sedebokerense]